MPKNAFNNSERVIKDKKLSVSFTVATNIDVPRTVNNMILVGDEDIVKGSAKQNKCIQYVMLPALMVHQIKWTQNVIIE